MTDDDEYSPSLEDQRVFGTGIKRKRIQFVPSSQSGNQDPNNIDTAATNTTLRQSRSSAGDIYASIVFKDEQKDAFVSSETSNPTSIATPSSTVDTEICSVCHLPLPLPNASNPASKERKIHECSLPHQLSLPHSHPPSAIDRKRSGFKYLSSHGWDPDARIGLGPEGRGIRVPIKGQVKNNTAGLGIKVKEGIKNSPEKKKLNAKQARKTAAEEKEKMEQLGRMFYMSDDVLKYGL